MSGTDPLTRIVERIKEADTASELIPVVATAIVFGLLFAQPFFLLVRDWWTLPEAGHGLLLAPVAVWLAARSGIVETPTRGMKLGLGFLAMAVLLRYASALAAELFTMRASMLIGLMGLIIYTCGFRQLLRWWLPLTLLALSIPLPELVTQAMALPLQFKASQMGAALLRMRDVPVLLTGNVIRIPNNELFVTEACSGLRSLTALLSVGVLLGGIVLARPVSRLLLILVAIPIAVAINGFRVFMTGFLVYFVNPELGKGFMHLTEGLLLFLVSLSFLGAAAWVAARLERRITQREMLNG
jgi:exosortase